MSTEEKKTAQNAEALSGEDMSDIYGGGIGSSKSGKPGGGEFLWLQENGKLSEADMSGVAGGRSKDGDLGGSEFLIDPEQVQDINILHKNSIETF